jgi:uncharacterized protein (DUF1015 family)
VRIRPFRGYRYAASASRDVSAVVAPPYDQVGPETEARLYAASPHNVIRITRPRREGRRAAPAAARATLAAWLRAGAWRRDPAPALYPYEQTFRADGAAVTRRGVVALGEVTEYAAGIVRPHERTHAGPRRERLRLLEATGADTGLLFMLVGDPDGALRRLTAPAGAPVAEAVDLRGEGHRLWRVDDRDAVAAVQAVLAPRPVVIADGHHRYESALAYARRHPGAGWKMMAFHALEGPGLVILPNHRLLRGLPALDLEALARAAAPWFEVTPLADPAAFAPTAAAFAVVTAREARAFRLRDGAAERVAWPPGASPAWRGLAVSVLHEAFLRPCLGVTGGMVDAGTHVDYTEDRAAALRLVREGRYQAACLVAPTRVDELLAVVEAGQLMPQKSTHFYPKLLDGLVFHRVSPAARAGPAGP